MGVGVQHGQLTLDKSAGRGLWWLLRVAAAMCYVGHGAFGVIGKAEWLPFFALVGIGADHAWTLMPLIGVFDIMLGLSVLVAPVRLVLLHMVVWSVWTGALRPLTGDSPFELLERAGNYGVPLALLILCGIPARAREWLRPVREPAVTAEHLHTMIIVLMWTTALLLIGHGALGAVERKPLLVAHVAAIGLPGSTAVAFGWLELTAALLVLAHPRPLLLVGVALWKIGTELLFPVAGAPVWEFIERGGSYAAPLALALLLASGVRAREQAGAPARVEPQPAVTTKPAIHRTRTSGGCPHSGARN